MKSKKKNIVNRKKFKNITKIKQKLRRGRKFLNKRKTKKGRRNLRSKNKSKIKRRRQLGGSSLPHIQGTSLPPIHSKKVVPSIQSSTKENTGQILDFMNGKKNCINYIFGYTITEIYEGQGMLNTPTSDTDSYNKWLEIQKLNNNSYTKIEGTVNKKRLIITFSYNTTPILNLVLKDTFFDGYNIKGSMFIQKYATDLYKLKSFFETQTIVTIGISEVQRTMLLLPGYTDNPPTKTILLARDWSINLNKKYIEYLIREEGYFIHISNGKTIEENYHPNPFPRITDFEIGQILLSGKIFNQVAKDKDLELHEIYEITNHVSPVIPVIPVIPVSSVSQVSPVSSVSPVISYNIESEQEKLDFLYEDKDKADFIYYNSDEPKNMFILNKLKSCITKIDIIKESTGDNYKVTFYKSKIQHKPDKSIHKIDEGIIKLSLSPKKDITKMDKMDKMLYNFIKGIYKDTRKTNIIIKTNLDTNRSIIQSPSLPPLVVIGSKKPIIMDGLFIIFNFNKLKAFLMTIPLDIFSSFLDLFGEGIKPYGLRNYLAFYFGYDAITRKNNKDQYFFVNK